MVSEQSMRRFRRISFQAGVGKQEDVCRAIIVVVNESATATIGFEDVFLSVNSSVNDGRIKPSRFRDVGKVRIERPP
jgi:hypothetical protein